jgi:hypothetical protein
MARRHGAPRMGLGMQNATGLPDRLKRQMLAGHGKQAMRYVIGICIVTAFLVWDVGYNDGRYITYTVMELKRLTAMVGA